MRRDAVRAALLVALVLLAGGSSSSARRVLITGHVSGASLSALLAGRSALVDVAALVRCNGSTVATARDGTFHLSLPPAGVYRCQVLPPPDYLPAGAVLGDPASGALTLTFDLPGARGCANDALATAYACGALALRKGAITGSVVYAGGGPAAGALVQCVNAAAPVTLVFSPPTWLTTRADAAGGFSLRNVPAGNYGCVATGLAQQQSYLAADVRPAVTIHVSSTLCRLACPPMRYHDGQIMHAYHAYLIFWLPAGYRYDYDAAADDSAFEAAIGQYFRDVGGSSFAGILAQYWDFQGPAASAVALGGVAVDTTPYQHCPSGGPCQRAAATTADPLYDADVQAEIARVMLAHHWTGGLGNEFFVFLAGGAQECQDASAGATCTYVKNDQAFCGYHSWFQPYDSAAPVVYASISDAATARNACLTPLAFAAGASPHGDWLLDAEISVISHEQFESVTDPVPTDQNTGGWFDANGHASDSTVAEIADQCQQVYGAVRPGGGNVTLGGHAYLVQAEWSNAANACVLRA